MYKFILGHYKMQLRCVLLFRNILILVAQCDMDKTIYSNLISTKLLNKSKHMVHKILGQDLKDR